MVTTSAFQTVLIVDDNPTNLEVLSETLSCAGFEVAVAIDGETALEQVSYQKPELILLDIMMPGLDGFETCRRLKEDPQTKDIPVIFATALSDAENKVEGLALGAVDYITKPFYRDEVLARVKLHLNLYNLTGTLAKQNAMLQAEVKQRQNAEAALCKLNEELEKLNGELEKRVEERTSELTTTLHQLQQAQVQLTQSRNMSLLGQLVTGVAHEINNPVNFIHDNLKRTAEYTEALLQLIELYQKQCLDPFEIQELIAKADLAYINQELPKVLSSMQLGVEHIYQIVSSLKHFSQPDESEIRQFDLHEGINSTLFILQHRLHSKHRNFSIQVIKDYGDLPLVECYPGLMNQVFMNLLSNAITALEEKGRSSSLLEDEVHCGLIRIRTEKVQDDSVLITITDNGIGIPEEMLSNILEPFPIIKSMSTGSNLGLSVSQQIVLEKHRGKIWCHSNPEAGTEFQIQIPIKQELK